MKKDESQGNLNNKENEAKKLSDTKILKEKNNNEEEELEFTLYVYFYKYSCFCCKKMQRAAIKCTKSYILIEEYDEIFGEFKNVKKYLLLKNNQFLNSAIHQKKLIDRYSFSIYYIEESFFSSKSKVKQIRLYADNRWECERYCSRLKELYSLERDSEKILILNNPKNNENIINENQKFKKFVKIDPKILYIKSKIVEDLLLKIQKRNFLDCLKNQYKNSENDNKIKSIIFNNKEKKNKNGKANEIEFNQLPQQILGNSKENISLSEIIIDKDIVFKINENIKEK